MRGVILAIAPDGTYGQLSADDGQRYSYWTSEVRNGQVRVGQMVEFQMWEGQPVDIFAVANPAPPNAPPPQSQSRPGMQQPATYGAAQPSPFSGGPAPYGAAHAGAYAAAGSFPPREYWIKLFTSPSGRISRRQFWLHGVLPIFVASIVLGWIPIIGQILTLAFMWGGICIAFKRFHDLGYPGWYSLLYLVPMVAAGFVLGISFVITSLSSLAWLLAEILWGIGLLIGLAQLIFVYVRIGQEGPNQYGPDPLTS
jgi:uncharacterized membrane protein YhaH (DUF805 family)